MASPLPSLDTDTTGAASIGRKDVILQTLLGPGFVEVSVFMCVGIPREIAGGGAAERLLGLVCGAFEARTETTS